MPSFSAGLPPAGSRWWAGRRLVDDVTRRRGHTRIDARRPGSPRTDLAVEAHQAVVSRSRSTVPEVETERESGRYASVHRVRITGPRGAAALGKAPGTYTTVESPQLRQRSQEAKEEVAGLVAKELAGLLRRQGVGPDAPVLVAGLGNWNATPDSLGPRVVGQILVTRHLHEMLPPEKKGSLRPVSAISPGVLGLTGIETTELVAGVVQRTQPAAVICIDALAAASPDRLCSTVQISDAGIQPGAGVGNVRRGLNRETLGIPVVAVGVPTVIHASRLGGVGDGWAGAPAVPPGAFPPLLHGEDARSQAAPMVSGAPFTGDGAQADDDFLATLVVTPKEIDVFIEDASEVVAGALNDALHPGLDLEEVLRSI